RYPPTPRERATCACLSKVTTAAPRAHATFASSRLRAPRAETRDGASSWFCDSAGAQKDRIVHAPVSSSRFCESEPDCAATMRSREFCYSTQQFGIATRRSACCDGDGCHCGWQPDGALWHS